MEVVVEHEFYGGIPLIMLDFRGFLGCQNNY